MMVTVLRPRAVVVLCVAAASATAADPQRARVACDAQFSLPCARTNSEYLAWATARQFAAAVAGGTPAADVLEQITAGQFNMDSGFYPFVFEAATSRLVAHGERSSLVGHDLQYALDELHLQYVSADALHARFVAAANTADGEWVQYLWPTRLPDGSYTATSKMSYVVGVNREDGGLLCLGVGFADSPLPPELPCSSGYDTFCSVANVRSLVGKAATLLHKADSRANFEEALLQLSYNAEDFQLPGGFYTFAYSYDGPLVSHARLHDYFGESLVGIFRSLGRSEDGVQLHQRFIDAAEGAGDGWVRYEWRNPEEDPYTKISYVVKVMFEEEPFYLGAGFNFVIGDSLLGPLDEVCPTNSNLPCALVNTLHLSSHTLAHAVSSTASIVDTFDAINDASTGLAFKSGDFYAFFYNFNGTCVAHGAAPRFVGLTMPQVFEEVNIPLDAALLHQKFSEAAQAGGGWVQYDWTDPNRPGSSFPKVSYIFKFVRDGQDYYGGVGFTNVPAPHEPFIAHGRRLDGNQIACSRKYGTPCSERNSLSILGQGLTDLTMASEAKVTVNNHREHTLDAILRTITSAADARYNFNDYFISVFAFDGNEACGEQDDGSGCCVAHGGDSMLVGKTWQQILEHTSVVSVVGGELHTRLRDQANAGGGWIEYSWAIAGEESHQTKRAWTARFTSDGDAYYVMVDYFTTPPPPTCGVSHDTDGVSVGTDVCPESMVCEESGEFCVPSEPLSTAVLGLIVALIIVSLAFAYKQWRNRVAKQRRALEAEQDKLSALKNAETLAAKTMQQALVDQAAALELKKQGMTYPDHWKLGPPRTLADGTTAQMPQDGLIEVPQTSSEYWDVHDLLRKKPNQTYAKVDPNTGMHSDTQGMHDAWITKLYRIQNPDLYTYYDSQKERLRTSGRGTAVDRTGNVKEVQGWHGTGNFEAANIYEDRQDGFMMQFASAGQWGRGLYFAEEAGYSHIYASKAAHMQDGGASKGMQSDEREFMLVSLLVGAEIEMDRDAPGLTEACKGLRTPPSVSGCQTKPSLAGDGVPACAAPPQPVPGHKYNTVRGYTQTDQRQANGSWQKNASCPRSRVWIVYENGRAYPQYLIRYYRGAFSSDRLLYRSREEAAELQNAKGGGKQASLDAFGETTRLVPLDSLDRRLPLPAFCHVNPDGSTTPYESRQNEIIAEARSLNKPSVRLEDVHLADGTCMKFEVRFGAQAVSRKLRTSPSSGMIQVNLENENTRVVLEI